MPLVLFRDSTGAVGALLDRCPHRNVPLSLGEVVGETLRCSYHGWEFDREGACRAVPGLLGEPATKGRRAVAFAAREQQGYVWVYATPETQPIREPFRFPLLDDRRYTIIRQQMAVEATLHATAENALDVPHTAYLHGGLFRSTSGTRKELEVIVRRYADRVEAEYVGESRPAGLIGKLLAPKGGEVIHVDRFILPSIAQVEYRLGERTHLCVTTALTPEQDFYTRLFTVAAVRLPILAGLLASVLKSIGLHIFRQDADMLKEQTETIRKFGGEQYHSTEIDVLGSHITRLLNQAERGERTQPQEPVITKVRMMV